MKIILFIILPVILYSCIGVDTSFYPETIKESKEKQLYINSYKPSKNQIRIGDGDYLIKESWTTYKFINKFSKKINYKSEVILISLQNLKTNQKGLSLDDTVEYEKYIKRKNYEMSIGINDGGLFIHKDIDFDTIKIEFLDKKGNGELINFVRK